MTLRLPCSLRLGVVAVLLAVPAVRAQTTTLLKSVVASGGTDATTGTTRLRGTLGQAVAGRVSGGSHVLDQGFWASPGTGGPVVFGPTLVVNSTADPGDGTCDAANCTLREAITTSNGTASNEEILFDISGTGLHTITPLTPLPALTDTVRVDGYSQPGASANTLAVGNNAVMRIELNGNGAAFAGLTVTAGGSVVRGLVIDQFSGNGLGYGIILQTGGANTVAGTWIGVDPTGTLDRSNSRGGIYMEGSAANVIGGTDPADRNVIIGVGNTAIFEQGTGGGHTIQGNYVGTNATGTAALARGGIWLVSSGTLIGGTAPGARNVLSTGGGVPGVFFSEEGASDNTVQGNYIGVTADGAAALAPSSGSSGISVQRAGGILIGGTTEAARNVIATLGGAIYLFGAPTSGAGNTIQGNYLGTNAAGTALVLAGVSAGAAVRIEGVGNTLVGGTAPGAGNVIAGSTVGVLLYSALPGNVVQGNFIGTNAVGTAALPNAEGVVFGGLAPSDESTIGGTTAAARNVISGNTGDGIRLASGSGNTIQGNHIGVAADGTTALGNGGHGVELGVGNGNRVGGTAPGAGNVIAYNGLPSGQGYGVWVQFGTGNAIEGNAIYGNGRIAINLLSGDAADGATANDPGDADAGPNNVQNTPEITASTLVGDQLTVSYEVDTAPANAAYPLRIEFFRALDGAGGAAFLGSDTYTEADHGGCGAAPCAKTVTVTPAAALVLTDLLTATATDADGNTSEFSAMARSVPTEPGAEAPTSTTLYAPAPNPAVGRSRLRYDLSEAGRVRLAVYDLLGREVALLVDADQFVGRFEADLETGALASGVYVVRLQSGATIQSHRLTVLR